MMGRSLVSIRTLVVRVLVDSQAMRLTQHRVTDRSIREIVACGAGNCIYRPVNLLAFLTIS